MSKLDELIKELCPNGVEYQPIGEICDTVTDYTAAGSFADIAKNVKYINDSVGYAQLIRTTDLKSNFTHVDKFVYVDEHAFRYLWRVNLDAEALVLPNIGNCGEIYYINPDMFPHKHNVLGPNALLVKSSVCNIRFLFHLFSSTGFRMKLDAIVSKVGQTKFNKTNLKKIEIPFPPLEVQEEIVRILDEYSEKNAHLIDTLNAELEARKVQYEYYRNKLMTQLCSNGVKCRELSEVLTIKNGRDYKCYAKGDVPVYGSGGIITYIDTYSYDKCSVLIPRKGSLNKLYYVEKPFWNVDTIFYTEINEKMVCPKFVYFYLQTLHLEQLNTASGVPSLTQSILNRIKIPVPSLEVQEEIVRILDEYSEKNAKLIETMTKEIKLRQTKYEHYRDKLLSFKEAN